MPQIIDTHSHLNFDAYKEDLPEVIKRTLDADIFTINVGTSFLSSQKAVELAEKYDKGFFASIGLHPMYAASEFIKIHKDLNEGELIQENDFKKEKYRELARSKKVIAIGEIGLDYYYKPKTTAKLEQFKEKQKEVFLEQLDLANELNLPVILHCRMAHEDVLEILKSYIINHKSISGVIHCFTGSLKEAQEYVKMGFFIGINAIIFKLNLDEVVKKISIEHILIETDCPYLTPPMAKNKRNEPIFIKHTIEKIANLKGVTFNAVCQKTTENARKVFNI